MTQDQLFELAGKAGGRTTRKVNSPVPVLLMSADNLAVFAAAVLVADGETRRLSAGRATCDVPPAGWRCTRAKGHSGPCAAVAA
jgi:hypothetical protein